MKINWDVIDKIAKNIRAVRVDQSADYLQHQLELWWSVKYNRPLKDPLLKEYSLYELIYEYLVHYYMDPANDPSKKEEAEKEEAEDMEWVKRMTAQASQGKPSKKKKSKKKKKAKKSKASAEHGTDGMFIMPSEVPDVPFPDLPDVISSKIDE